MERSGPSFARDALFVVLMATLLLLPAGACTLAWGHGASPSPSPAARMDLVGVRPNGSLTTVVTSTVDGDTVHVRIEGRDEKVRFIGVDTPEVGWYGGGDQGDGGAGPPPPPRRRSGREVRRALHAGRPG